MKRRILVVDDNADAADMMAVLLGCHGLEVQVAYSGQQALDLVQSGAVFDVVLLDIGMPGMDGFETAQRLRRLTGATGITVIALTAWSDERSRDRSRDAGFDLHLVKPVATDIVLAAIEQLS